MRRFCIVFLKATDIYCLIYSKFLHKKIYKFNIIKLFMLMLLPNLIVLMMIAFYLILKLFQKLLTAK